MTQEQIKQLQDAVAQAVEKTVNGKITSLHNKLDTYIADDMEWKQAAEPVIKMGEYLQGTSKVLFYLTGAVIAVGGAVKILVDLIKNE